MRKVESLGYGNVRSSVWKNGVLKVVTFKKNVANNCSVIVEKFVANVGGFGNTKVSSFEMKIN
jgi:lysophospholipid acyltransferase (LPLAT)-like uncharacterized protein